jgi:hypothetical protein
MRRFIMGKLNGNKIGIFLGAFVMASCSAGGGINSKSELLSSYSPKPANLRVSLTDAPNHDLKEVHINVDHAELWLEKDGNEGRLLIAQGLGDIDLLKLKDGILLPLADVAIPAGIKITKIRLILNSDNNYAIKGDNSICPMQTPSGQQSGIKILLHDAVEFEGGFNYSMVMDFDAAKSVVVKGNGGCLLKPVLKLPLFNKAPAETTPDNGGVITDPTDETPVTDGGDSNTIGGDGTDNPPDLGDGFDPTDPSTWPPGFTIEDISLYM